MDFTATDHGSIWLLTPTSQAGQSWAEEHLPADAATLGSSIAIEPRYVLPILDGIEEDGLEVRVRP